MLAIHPETRRLKYLFSYVLDVATPPPPSFNGSTVLGTVDADGKAILVWARYSHGGYYSSQVHSYQSTFSDWDWLRGRIFMTKLRTKN